MSEDAKKMEKEQRDKISSMQQKENNHMKAVLASAAAYMEVNLSRNKVLEKSDDHIKAKKRFIKNIPSVEEIPGYSDIHKWICDNLIVENKDKYMKAADRLYLIDCFKKGERRSSVFFSVYSKDGGLQPCREIFFLYEEHETRDIYAFCVIYDLTEQQKREREMEKLESELRMSRIHNFTGQMQSHFLYNALGSIQEIILMDPKKASDLLGDFTVHLRSCVRAMVKDKPLPFEQEIENIRAYINIEQMRFGKKLKVHYDLKTTDFVILPLTVQPIVENAIRHGIYGRGPEGGDVYIRTDENDECWIVEVEDNGVGFDTKNYKNKQGMGENDSLGLKNAKFRLQALMGAEMRIKSEVNKGTLVTVMIPKRKEQNERDNC